MKGGIGEEKRKEENNYIKVIWKIDTIAQDKKSNLKFVVKLTAFLSVI